MQTDSRFQQILGVRFFVGDAQGAIAEVSRDGGLVVVPAAPAMKNLAADKGYREALLGANFAIADSAFMVLLWNMIDHHHIPKLSGLKYLRALIEEPGFRQGGTFWVMPTPASSHRNIGWLRAHGVKIENDDVYLAPLYEAVISDEELLARLEARKPKHIVLGLGGGTQERLGLYLKQKLTFKPAIHCVGAAIAFLSGDQVRIPSWADACGLGWLYRSVSDPKQFVPRYWDARHLAPLLFKYRDRLPN